MYVNIFKTTSPTDCSANLEIVILKQLIFIKKMNEIAT